MRVQPLATSSTAAASEMVLRTRAWYGRAARCRRSATRCRLVRGQRADGGHPQDPAAQVDGVQLAVVVLPEGRQGCHRGGPPARRSASPVGDRVARRTAATGCPSSSRRTGRRRSAPGYGVAAVDVAADDGAAIAAGCEYVATGSVVAGCRSQSVASKQSGPSMTLQPKLAPPSTGGQDVDLLPLVLADVADEHVAGQPVDAEAPRVAQARSPGSPGGRRGPDGPSGSLAGTAYGSSPSTSMRSSLPSSWVTSWPLLLRVAATTAIAGADEQHPLGVEREHAAVVVRREVGHLQDQPLGAGSTTPSVAWNSLTTWEPPPAAV